MNCPSIAWPISPNGSAGIAPNVSVEQPEAQRHTSDEQNGDEHEQTDEPLRALFSEEAIRAHKVKGCDDKTKVDLPRNYDKLPPDKKTALDDVFWAILNSREFMFNH